MIALIVLLAVVAVVARRVGGVDDASRRAPARSARSSAIDDYQLVDVRDQEMRRADRRPRVRARRTSG